jgi:hypothetical protein
MLGRFLLHPDRARRASAEDPDQPALQGTVVKEAALVRRGDDEGGSVPPSFFKATNRRENRMSGSQSVDLSFKTFRVSKRFTAYHTKPAHCDVAIHQAVRLSSEKERSRAKETTEHRIIVRIDTSQPTKVR